MSVVILSRCEACVELISFKAIRLDVSFSRDASLSRTWPATHPAKRKTESVIHLMNKFYSASGARGEASF